MGLLESIKRDVKKSGSSKGKFIYFKEGQKARIRFLQDIDDGMEVTFHDSYEQGINVPCREHFGKNCPYCEQDGLRTRSQYIWSVWDYEAKEVKLFMFPVNSFSPVPSLMAMYDNYGTLMDRDFIISRSGTQTNTSYSVVPMDKAKFRNDKAKPYSESQVYKFLDKAYPDENADEDDDEDFRETKKSKVKPEKKKSKSKKDDDDDITWEDLSGESEDENSYEDMSAKELYKLCEERDIDCEPKKPAKYYINLLEEYDNAQEDWDDSDDDEDEDEWEDDDE